jgi:2-polyprenyl-3-methyl-5-hydroxy-6-metoxy-1,4-benzoquinol methylase
VCAELDLRNESCPVCGSDERDVVGKSGRMNSIFTEYAALLEDVDVVRCRSCTLMYMYPIIYFSDAFTARLYNVSYFGRVGSAEVEDFKNVGEKRRILRRAVKFLEGDPRDKQFLDIGCGTGEYLKVAAECGMQVTGVDVDESITEYVRAKLGYKVVTARLDDETFRENTFHVVVLSHVIEHLQNPNSLVGSIRKLLKPGGIFIIAMPNADSFLENLHELYGRVVRDWKRTYILTPFISPYHINGFNLKSGARLLQNHGFRTVYSRAQSGLDWLDDKHKLVMKGIKLLGFCMGKGVSLVMISRKEVL